MVAALLHLDEGAGAAGEFRDQMGRGLAGRHDVGDGEGARAPSLRRRSFSALPSTRETPGRAAQRVGCDLGGAAGDDDAAPPGVRDAARRMAWRAWRSASR